MVTRMQVLEDVYLVGAGRFRYTHPTNCNIYLVDGGSETGLIDAGSGINIRSLLDSIRQNGFDPKDISLIADTHNHWDHARGSSKLQRISNCEIAIHELGAERLEKGPWPAPAPDPQFVDYVLPFEPARVTKKLHDGDTIRIGKHELRVIHTPGHTPDSCCFLMKSEGKKILFSSDIVSAFCQPALTRAETVVEYVRSVRKLAKLKVDVLCPGHGAFILSDAYEHVEFLLEKLTRVWRNFTISYDQPFTSMSSGYSTAWELSRHPEWLQE